MPEIIGTLLTSPIGLGTGSSQGGLPGTRIAGPRGIESVIEFNRLYLNVREWVDTYLVTTVGGLDDADIRDVREVNPGYHGETAFISYYGGRTITLNGKVITRTLFKLRDMQQALRKAFVRLDTEIPLIFRGPSPELDFMIYCKKSQAIQMADEQRTANHFERPFLITLRASNPRFVSSITEWQEKSFPGATFDAIGMTLNNNGNYPAQPEIELTGPFTTLAFVNEANNHYMALTAAVPTGEKWLIDIMRRRMYRRSDNANRFMYFDVASDWMELEPEVNSIRITATGLTAASRITFTHRHTYM